MIETHSHAAVGSPRKVTATSRALAAWPGFFALFCFMAGAWFFLYATLGEGFAVIGLAPFYVGEVLLAVGVVAAVTSRRVGSLLRTPLGILLSYS